MFLAITSYLQMGATLQVGYKACLRLVLTHPIQEQEILGLLQEGWSEYVEYNGYGNNRITELKMN
jgi:hypothetical protein